jgi:hypothetical protein
MERLGGGQGTVRFHAGRESLHDYGAAFDGRDGIAVHKLPTPDGQLQGMGGGPRGTAGPLTDWRTDRVNASIESGAGESPDRRRSSPTSGAEECSARREESCLSSLDVGGNGRLIAGRRDFIQQVSSRTSQDAVGNGGTRSSAEGPEARTGIDYCGCGRRTKEHGGNGGRILITQRSLVQIQPPQPRMPHGPEALCQWRQPQPGQRASPLLTGPDGSQFAQGPPGGADDPWHLS